MKNITVTALLHEHQSEYPHSRQVTKLALQIFDAVQKTFSLTEIDRKILTAAATLHDVGFAIDPAKHATASVHILDSIHLKNFTPVQQNLTTATISLHRRNYKSVLQKKEYLRLKHPERAIKLGAILRVADGLDHSHIQDAVIKRILVTSKRVTLYAQSKWYPKNLPWAYGKANLWNDYLPLPIRITPVPHAPLTYRYQGLVNRNDTILEAFRTLLGAQFRVYLDNITGSSEGTDSSYLHVLRVTLRRARMLFAFFSPKLKKTKRKQHARYIKKLTSTLGPYRDSQVWIDFLEQFEKDPTWTKNKTWKQFYSAEKRKDQCYLPYIKKALLAPDILRSNNKLSLYLRSVIPTSIEQDAGHTLFRPFAASQLRKQFKMLLHCRLIGKEEDPEIMHDVRKLVRKTRYYAEIAEIVLPPVIRELTKRLKLLADSMGNLHDMDVHRQHLAKLKKQHPPPRLLKQMKQLETGYRSDYEKTWEELFDKSFLKRVDKALKSSIKT